MSLMRDHDFLGNLRAPGRCFRREPSFKGIDAIIVRQRLIYIANAHLPGEKTDGYQICQMCETFAQNGAKVLLLHPYRRQASPVLQGRTVFDYYGMTS
jgi:hypothetical protein